MPSPEHISVLECVINNKTYDISLGAVFIENYNETLDSGTIIIPQVKEKIDIEPYDLILIRIKEDYEEHSFEKKMCVDKITCTQTSLNPAIYQYEITLFSQTKLLEGILLPSLSITKLLSGTKRKVWYYLNQYLSDYGTKSKYYYVPDVTSEPKFIFADRVRTKFNSIDCPEMQWNEPTLREVLTDLMMVADCIPVVKTAYVVVNGETVKRDFVIDYMDISAIGSEVSDKAKEGINYITETQSSDDYVSELKMNLKNVANNSVKSQTYPYDPPEDKTKICENIGFRSEESYILTSENCIVETSFPMWNLYKVLIKFSASARVIMLVPDPLGGDPLRESHDITGRVSIDLTRFVLEYGIWQTKDVYYDPFGGQAGLSANYQNRCLYYKRGERGIRNFNAKHEYAGLFVPNQVSVLELIEGGSYARSAILAKAREEYPGKLDYMIDGDVTVVGGFANCAFEVEYEPIDDCVFTASKSPLPRNKRVVIDNQTNSYVDAKRQGMLEYLKANRLGNKVKLINARYKANDTSRPGLAQTVNGSVIFRKEIAYYHNYLKANYYATDNYVLRDYFTGVKAKLRSWRLVSGNEAFVRADLIKFYIGSHVNNIYTNDFIFPKYDDLQTYMTRFKYCVVSFFDKNGNVLPRASDVKYLDTEYGINGIMVEMSKHICGNSLLITFNMGDNTFAGKYINNINGDGGAYQKNCSYVDENGENFGGIIYFYENFNSASTIYENLLPGICRSNQMSTLLAKIPFSFRKDNKEITQITIQIEMNEDANDILLGKK